MLQVPLETFSALDRVMRKINAIVRTPRAIVLDVPELSEDKLAWLKAQGRDFTKLTPKLREASSEAFTREVKKLIAGTSTDFDAPWKAVGLELARAIRDRIDDGHGGDVKMRQLKADTVKAKREKRYSRPTAIGYATGSLRADIARAAAGRGSGIRVVR